MTHLHLDSTAQKSSCWRRLNRLEPRYQAIPPLPHAVLPQNEPLVIDFDAGREGQSPLQLSRLDDKPAVGGRRTRVIEWLYHLAGVIAPAELTRLTAIVSPDDELMPSLDPVFFRELAATWDSIAFATLFDNHSADFHFEVSTELEPSGFKVEPIVWLSRVGPEIITGPLAGLDFVDEALEQANQRWGQFCHDARHWLLDCGISRLAVRGTTATLPRR